MNTTLIKSIYASALFILVGLSSSSCAGSGFGGAGGILSGKVDGSGSARKKPRQPEGTDRDGVQGTQEAEGIDSLRAIRTSSESIKPNTPLCPMKSLSSFNIVMVLDNSNSQKRTDPDKIRRGAALQFVKNLNFIPQKPSRSVKVAMVEFNDDAKPYPFIELDGKNVESDTSEPIDRVGENIVKATENTEKGTKFLPAFAAANSLLKTLGESALKPDVKTYVLFMTDGRPTSKYTESEIEALVVTPFKAAIVSIGTGERIANRQERRLEKLALPKSGPMRGLFFEVDSPAEYGRTFDRIFREIGGCD